MYQSKLPADPIALILGIVALVLGIAGCCCYGITAILPLAMAIIGLITAKKSIKTYKLEPDVYEYRSYSNTKIAQTLNIIAIIFNGLIVLIFIGFLIFYGSYHTIMPSVLEEIQQQNKENDTYDTYNLETDSLQVDIYDYSDIEQDNDSTYIDSIQ